MELTSSAVTGAMRLGLQVVSSHKRPKLEIYHQIRNRYGPELEFETPLDHAGEKTYKSKHRLQDVFVDFLLINIGGQRAENILLSMNGSFTRDPPREDFGDVFGNIYPQMGPGQARYLFQLLQTDLFQQLKENQGHPDMKEDSIIITIEYDSEAGWLNWVISLPHKILGRRRYRDVYTFFPKMVGGDLPPAEYTV